MMNSISVGVLLSPAMCNNNVIDFVSGSELQGGLSISPDDDVFVHLAKTYSYSHSEMHNGNGCYDSQDFSHGITNGYQWYPLPGKRVVSISLIIVRDSLPANMANILIL